MNINIDGKDYEIDEKDEKNAELMGVLGVIRTGDGALPLLQHIQQCVQAVHSGKLQELKNLLPKEEKETKPKKEK
mgnify:FL=1|tara:strand:+ start:228 stop:452 length:225 start_codon:yes stop_codon:yes gene_type:complete